MLKEVDETQDVGINQLSIERFQLEIKQFSKELPKLKSQMDALQGRIEFFKQRKQELITMREEYKKLEHEVQLALEEKILKENEFHRVVNCRETMRNIYKCRSSNDLAQKIFYALPMKVKHAGEKNEGNYKLSFD
jgi:CTP:phosphocholine cytidylyltransferase-like protein